MRKFIIGTALALSIVTPLSIALAKDPVQNVNKNKHPNIAAAQKLGVEAFEKIEAAQKANEFDMDGHAQKAKDLLKQANDELKLAAEAANKNAK